MDVAIRASHCWSKYSFQSTRLINIEARWCTEFATIAFVFCTLFAFLPLWLFFASSSLSAECASVRTQIGWNQFAFAWTELTMMNPRDTCRPFGRQPNDWVTVTHLTGTQRGYEQEKERKRTCKVLSFKAKNSGLERREKERGEEATQITREQGSALSKSTRKFLSFHLQATSFHFGVK